MPSSFSAFSKEISLAGWFNSTYELVMIIAHFNTTRIRRHRSADYDGQCSVAMTDLSNTV